jgi:hypothetical protein
LSRGFNEKDEKIFFLVSGRFDSLFATVKAVSFTIGTLSVVPATPGDGLCSTIGSTMFFSVADSFI